MAPQVLAHPGTRPTGRIKTVDTRQFSAPHAHPSTEDQDHHDRDERPHICNHGWISIASIVVDEETGEETEEYALYLCQRCVGDKVERG
jgi:hypothetical protein